MSAQEEVLAKFKEILTKYDIKLFDFVFLKELDELNSFQSKNIQKATSILEKNIVGEVKYFGGDLDEGSEVFENLIKGLKTELEDEKNDEYRDELQDLLDQYLQKLEALIEKTCYAIIPVKEMPWKDVLFRTLPKIEFKNGKIILFDNIIAFYGEIDTSISKTTIYGKINNEKPLFAPVMGDIQLDIDQTRENIEEGTKKVYNFSYINAVINSLEKDSILKHLTRYDQGYQRHGEPISDFLQQKQDLMKAMNNLVSAIESDRVNKNSAICGIALPEKNAEKTIVITLDERESADKFEKCFEAVLRFSAACYEAPKADMIRSAPQGAPRSSHQHPSAQQGESMRTPGGQEMKVWTSEELAKEAKKRQASSLPEGVEEWSEEELEELTKQRNRGIPDNMEMWSKEELEELAKKRQGGGLDIPEWKPDDDMLECPNCGYTVRKEWTKCPICDTPLEGAPESPTKTPSENEDTDDEKPSEVPEKTDNSQD
jgi:rubrerythrin